MSKEASGWVSTRDERRPTEEGGRAVDVQPGVPLAPGELLFALRKALLEGLHTALLLPERRHLLSQLYL